MDQPDTSIIRLKEFYVFNSTITSADIDKIKRRLSKSNSKDSTHSTTDESGRPTTSTNETISNDQPSTDEDELAKILYYYPPGTDTNTKLKKVGLCEAIIKFTENFHTRPSCDSVNTQKTRYVLHEPEPNYWFVIVLTIPSCSKISPEGLEMTEYLSDSVQDSVYKALLKQLYRKFVFLNDTLEQFVSKTGIGQLRIKMGRYLDAALPKIDMNNCGINEIFHGLQFQPLDRQLFLDFQCFNNRLMLEYPDVSKVLFYQNEKIIWCGIGQTDVQVFNDYFLRDILGKINRESKVGFVFKKESHISLQKDTTMGTSSDIAKYKNGEIIVKDREYFHMLIYKSEQSFLTILVPQLKELTPDLISKLDSYLSINLTPLSNTLKQIPCSVDFPATAPNVKFLYFNNLNLAAKSTLTPPTSAAEEDAYKLLADLKSDLKGLNKSGNAELIVKMLSDCWIVAKTSNHREFYAIFNNKGSNLLEIEEELKKLTDLTLSNIFFQS